MELYSRGINNKITKGVAIFFWILVVLYPNPCRLAASVYRLSNPPVSRTETAWLAEQLRDSAPEEVREIVYSILPYNFDWEVYHMPWYFPTLEEALQKGTGDCKARYILFASLLEELEIPYQKKISFTHIWAAYEGMPETLIENEREVLFTVDKKGHRTFNIPRADIKRSWHSFYRGFWEVMPIEKKILLMAGFPIVSGLFDISRRRKV
ncbi:MAG TPA: hypothetical protein ENN91_00880 [Firmicutes bacterium]|nr:hypothetical protein [Bacillota bacterium]